MLLLSDEQDKPILPDKLIGGILQYLPANELLKFSIINKQWHIFCHESLSKRRQLTIGPLTVRTTITKDKLHFMSHTQLGIPLETDFSSFFTDAQRRYRASNEQVDHKLKQASSVLSAMFPGLKHLTLYSTLMPFHLEQFIDNLPSIWPKLAGLTVMNLDNRNNNNFEWLKFCAVLEQLHGLCCLSMDAELPALSKCSRFQIFNRLDELNTVIHVDSLHMEPELPYEWYELYPNLRLGIWFEYESHWNGSDPYYEISVKNWRSDSSLIRNLNKLRIKLPDIESVAWLVAHCRSLTCLHLTLYESAGFYRDRFLELFLVLSELKHLKCLSLQFFVPLEQSVKQRQTTEPEYRGLRPVDLLLTSHDSLNNARATTVHKIETQYEKPGNIQNICQRDVQEMRSMDTVRLLQIDFYIDPYEFAWIPKLFTNKKLFVKFALPRKDSSLQQYFDQIKHEFRFQYQTL